MQQAVLMDLNEDASKEIRDMIYDCIEPNGNPWYLQWYMDREPFDEEHQVKFELINDWLKSKGLTSESIIILTDGW